MLSRWIPKASYSGLYRAPQRRLHNNDAAYTLRELMAHDVLFAERERWVSEHPVDFNVDRYDGDCFASDETHPPLAML